jgi:nitrate/nitrite-specific signal transduction histidine kinase
LILLISIVSTFNYIPFVKWVSAKFLGTIYPIDNVINLYSEQISQQESIDELKQLIQKNLTTDLLIDQSIIVLMSDFKDDYQEININQENFIPNREKLTELQVKQPLEDVFISNSKYGWIRLILPIKTSDSFYGWWLIGEHSPDDVFSYDLIETLDVISIQIAMKISSIYQTQHIQSMYQIRVNREDAQESYILRELHDTVLNEFALLKEHVEEQYTLDEKTSEFFETITNSIRNTISGLRPPMQDYPLYSSIEDYCFQINQTKKIQVHNNIFYEPNNDFRYDEKLKLNLYRMIQQGINNALAHSEADEITIYGRLEEDYILIEISDDGKGMDLDIDFSSIDAVTISQLIQKRHFGIAGMYERAKLINASFDIESELYEGTNIIIEWFKDKNKYVKVLEE